MSPQCGPGGGRAGGAARGATSAPHLAAASAASTALASRGGGHAVRLPRELFVAVHLDGDGGVLDVVGVFGDEADARAHVDAEFDGSGCAAPFTMTMRSPPRRAAGPSPPPPG